MKKIYYFIENKSFILTFAFFFFYIIVKSPRLICGNYVFPILLLLWIKHLFWNLSKWSFLFSYYLATIFLFYPWKPKDFEWFKIQTSPAPPLVGIHFLLLVTLGQWSTTVLYQNLLFIYLLVQFICRILQHFHYHSKEDEWSQYKAFNLKTSR